VIRSGETIWLTYDAPREERGKLRDEMAERILDRLSEFLRDLRECIVERAVFSGTSPMHGATNGDFTHGLIHPEQMIGGRLLVPGSAHAAPIRDLWFCGASCYPGPGVTFPPGYGGCTRSRRRSPRADEVVAATDAPMTRRATIRPSPASHCRDA